jgi:dephospho-CoA kinase
VKIIGLTGGIGSGKSTVLKLFQELGMATYVADLEAKKLMNSDKELVSQLIHLFGEKAYFNGVLDTLYIASLVFNDKEKLQALNTLVHPKLHEHFKNFVQKSSAHFVMYEAAILFESGGNKLCDYIVTVTANFEDRIKRVMLRDNTSKAQILERMNHQLKDDYKIKNSNFVIRNTSLAETKLQVSTIYDLIVKLSK